MSICLIRSTSSWEITAWLIFGSGISLTFFSRNGDLLRASSIALRRGDLLRDKEFPTGDLLRILPLRTIAPGDFSASIVAESKLFLLESLGRGEAVAWGLFGSFDSSLLLLLRTTLRPIPVGVRHPGDLVGSGMELLLLRVS